MILSVIYWCLVSLGVSQRQTHTLFDSRRESVSPTPCSRQTWGPSYCLKTIAAVYTTSPLPPTLALNYHTTITHSRISLSILVVGLIGPARGTMACAAPVSPTMAMNWICGRKIETSFTLTLRMVVLLMTARPQSTPTRFGTRWTFPIVRSLSRSSDVSSNDTRAYGNQDPSMLTGEMCLTGTSDHRM